MKNLVKVERVRRNLQQQDLAKILNLSRQSIYSIEGGSYIPTALVALKLARLFDLKVEELFFLEESEKQGIIPVPPCSKYQD